jgi:transposase-like protein
MNGTKFQHLMAMLGELTVPQRQRIASALSSQGDLAEVISSIEARFGEKARCPHCQSLRVGSWGRSCGLRRYRCRACCRTFNALTGTPLAGLRKRGAWKEYAQALAEGMSVRQSRGTNGHQRAHGVPLAASFSHPPEGRQSCGHLWHC